MPSQDGHRWSLPAASRTGAGSALMLGASGAWLGTRFVASREAQVPPEYQGAIMGAPETDTVLTELFDGGWPAAPHRVLVSNLVRAWQDAGCPPPGRRPGEGEVIGTGPDGHPIQRYDADPPITGMTGDWQACALYAGQSAGLIYEILPADEIVRRVVEEAKATIARWQARQGR